ncbi:MAG: glycosyltransferase, partial [Acetobacteraceae bacterium]|nr:glycosyltransferase [Acetobacteraceae bacterium]
MARNNAGDEKKLSFAIHATEIISSGAAEHETGVEAEADLLLHVDLPILRGDKVADPVTTRLTIKGWALAREGVAALEVFLDGQSAGLAYYGQRREDIAEAFPDWTNALLSGFVFGLPANLVQRLRSGEHKLELRLSSEGGKQISKTILFERYDEQQRHPLFRERISPVETELYRQLLTSLDWEPCFKIALLTNPSEDNEKQQAITMQSLHRQVFENWKLAKPESIAQELTEGSSDNGSSFFVLVRAGDVLSCDALAEMAVATGLHRTADFVYCDEIRVNPATNAQEAFFKPQWSPDLLLSTNYIGRPWCIRFDLLLRAGFEATDLEQFGEYDLVLRCTEHACQIRHIPRVLGECGVADEPDLIGRAALARAAQRRGVEAEIVDSPVKHAFRFKRVRAPSGQVSIVIPTIAAQGHIKKCLESLRGITSYINFEIITIDNIPDPDSDWKLWLREHSDKVVEILEPFNWSRFNNEGARCATGKFLLFLNDDVEAIEPDWLDALLEHAQRPEVGVVGAKLLYPDRKVQHAGIFLTRGGLGQHAFRFLRDEEPGYFGLAQLERNVSAVTGACMLMRRSHFEEMGGFDEAHDVVNNDVDYCLRLLKAGYSVVYTPHARLVHHELASRAEIKDSFDLRSFQKQWGSIFDAGDPFFSPHLLKDHEDFRPDHEPPRTIFAGGPRILRDRIKRILALKLDHIGDFVTALPAIRRLRRTFPEARLSVLVGRATKALASTESSIDEVIEFDFFHARSGLGRREIPQEEFESLAKRLAAHRFDLAVDLRKAD